MSETLDLFKAALGLGEPWRVTRSDFDVVQGRLDLYLDVCHECGSEVGV